MKKENTTNIESLKTNSAGADILNGYATLIDGIASDSIPENAYVSIDEKTSIVKKEYEFSIPKGKRGQVAINNPAIILSVERISLAQQGQNLMAYVICKEFARLDSLADEIVKLGFNDVADFGATLFGYKSTTVNQYIRIGKYLIDDNYKPIPVLPSSISVSAMIELLAPANDGNNGVDVKKIAEWYGNGTLTDGMSRNKIRTALKDLVKPEIEDKETSTDDAKKVDTEKDTADSSDVSKATPFETENVIDRINDMEPDIAAGTALNAIEIIEAIFAKFANHADAKKQIDALKEIARSIIA